MSRRDSRAEIDPDALDDVPAPAPAPARRGPRDLQDVWDELIDLQADMRRHFGQHDRKIDELESRVDTYDRGENGRLQAKLDEIGLRETAWKARAVGWAEKAAYALGGLAIAWGYAELRTCIPTGPPAVIIPVVAPSMAPAVSSSPKAASSSTR